MRKCAYMAISLQCLHCGPSGVRSGWSLPTDLGASKTNKNKCFSKTPASQTRKNCFQTHLPVRARKSRKIGNTQKHVFSPCDASRCLRSDVEKAHKNRCFQPQDAEKTCKHMCLFHCLCRKHANAHAIRHICKKNAKTRVFGFLHPQAARAGSRLHPGPPEVAWR